MNDRLKASTPKYDSPRDFIIQLHNDGWRKEDIVRRYSEECVGRRHATASDKRFVEAAICLCSWSRSLQTALLQQLFLWRPFDPHDLHAVFDPDFDDLRSRALSHYADFAIALFVGDFNIGKIVDVGIQPQFRE